jgi:DNA polymerase III epsilon subunit-like protein
METNKSSVRTALPKMNFVTIDFETAKYSRESACAVGLVKYQDGKATDSYYSLIRPQTESQKEIIV